ncbi:MAG: AbrB/MazE/SpoVT family DNA-binding domain-containing protein [Pyrinomonadaceae bacterium]
MLLTVRGQIPAPPGIFDITGVMSYHSNMVVAQSKLTSQGQISVPAEIRRRLGLAPGSVLEWDEEGDKVVVRRATRYSFEDIHRRIFKTDPELKTLDELKEGIREHMRRKHARR